MSFPLGFPTVRFRNSLTSPHLIIYHCQWQSSRSPAGPLRGEVRGGREKGEGERGGEPPLRSGGRPRPFDPDFWFYIHRFATSNVQGKPTRLKSTRLWIIQDDITASAYIAISANIAIPGINSHIRTDSYFLQKGDG